MLSSLSLISSDISFETQKFKDAIPLAIPYPMDKRIVTPYPPLSLFILFIPYYYRHKI